MVHASASTTIARSPEEVWAFVADLRNEPSWHVDMESVPDDTDAVPVLGTSYPVTFKPFMGKTDGVYTVLAVESGRRVVYQAALAGIQPTITYEVTPDGVGSRFTRSVDLHLRGALSLMTPLMALMVPRRNRVFVDNLRRQLEG